MSRNEGLAGVLDGAGGEREGAGYIAEWGRLTEGKQNDAAQCAPHQPGAGRGKGVSAHVAPKPQGRRDQGISVTKIPSASVVPAASGTALGDAATVFPSAGAEEGITATVMPWASRCSPLWDTDADPLPALIWWDAAGRGHLVQPADPRMSFAEPIAGAELVGQVEPGLPAPGSGSAPGGGARAGPW